MGRPLRRLALTILALFAVLAGGLGYVSNAAQEAVVEADVGFFLYGGPGFEDRDCQDFATRAEAQRFFETRQPRPGFDRHGLDRDEDLVACEGFRN